MRVHLAQIGYGDDESVPERRDRVAALVARQAGADLIVLPELWAHTGMGFEQWKQVAEPVDGPTFTAIADATRRVGAYVHAGSIVERDEHGDYYNTSALLAPDGSRLATYRKIHRFGFSVGEPAIMQPGRDIATATITVDGRSTVVGLATCYDLRFPEMFRLLLDAGSEMIIVPAAWPAARVAHWTLLGRARAVENQVFVIAVNTAGTHNGVTMGSRSQLVDPGGTVLAELGDGEQVQVVDIDLGVVADVRRDFPVLADRRL
jgi:predicted amidohydrolase